MISEKAVKKREAWRKFFSFEKAFLEEIASNGNCLYEEKGYPPSYRVIQTATTALEKPPRFIRWVGVAEKEERELLADMKELRGLYLNALVESGDEHGKFPSRFPQYFPNVDRISLSTSKAYQSHTMNKSKRVQLKEMAIVGEQEEIQEIVTQFEKDELVLKRLGFTSSLFEIGQVNLGLGKVKVAKLSVSGKEFFAHFKANDITARRFTGEQYIAGVAADPNEKAIKTNFGFILVGNDDCYIHKSPRRKLRNDALENCATLLTLPVTTDIEFWKKRIIG